MVFFILTPLHSQEVPKYGYSILNLAPRKLNLTVMGGSTNVLAQMEGSEALDPGSFTGLLPSTNPVAILRFESKEYPPLELKQPFSKPGATPLFVLHEKKKNFLEVLLIPNATNRSPVFYDAVNLSSQPSLKLRANEKDFNLPWGERTRLALTRSLSIALPSGLQKNLETAEDDNFLLIFFTDIDGIVQCKVTRDNLL